jgi:hypothetical protein
LTDLAWSELSGPRQGASGAARIADRPVSRQWRFEGPLSEDW